MTRPISTRNARKIRRGISLGREVARHYQSAIDSINDEHEDPTVGVILMKVARAAHHLNMGLARESGVVTTDAFDRHAGRWGVSEEMRLRR